MVNVRRLAYGIGQKGEAMHAAIRKYELSAGSADQLIKIVEEGLIDVLSAEPGFVGYHIVASGASLTGEDEIVALTFFTDAESATRSHEIAAQFVKDHLEEHRLHLTEAMSGEVILSHSAPALAG